MDLPFGPLDGDDADVDDDVDDDGDDGVDIRTHPWHSWHPSHPSQAFFFRSFSRALFLHSRFCFQTPICLTPPFLCLSLRVSQD